MVASSITRQSNSRKNSSLRLKAKTAGLNSSKRWTVLAYSPVDSERRLAALPLGAQSPMLRCLALKIFRMLLTRVVLPTQGPPVMTAT